MLFTVYPQGAPPPRQGPNPLLIALGACGGCALIAVLAIVALGFVAMKAGQGMVKGFQQQKTQGEQFMNDIKAHRYAEAEAMLSPDGQRHLSEEALKAMVEKNEKKLGGLQSWETPNVNTTADRTVSINKTSKNGNNGDQNIPTGSPSKPRSMRFTYTYHVHFAKGDADAELTYISTDIFKPSQQIDRFALNPVDSGESDAPAPAPKSGQHKKQATNSDSGSNP